MPGQSGNVNGRPKTTAGLVNAIRLKVAEIAPDGRTVAQHIASMLIEEALQGRHRVAAASVILDRARRQTCSAARLKQHTHDLANRSDDELRYHLTHGHWPEDEGIPSSVGQENGTGEE